MGRFSQRGGRDMTDETPKGERIAKVMARAGVASRRDAEKMILAGRVAVNGAKVDSPALDIAPSDKVTLDGKPIDAPQPARLWLYYKPVGLVTSAKDEKGRQTVFDTMPEGMPRVMSVGRLDLTSEGLLLLTNDGALKRRLELPSTGWLRKYRVRVNGRPNEATFDPLRRGATIDGEEFQPMEVSLDKQQGANAWLTIGLREGKNREIRRAMTEVGLIVNRLIRVSYGPFRLNTMKPGDVVEVKQRVLRDQLGDSPADEERPARRKARHGAGPDRPRRDGDKGTKPRAGRKPPNDDARAARSTSGKPRRFDTAGSGPDRTRRGNEAEVSDRPARFKSTARPARDGEAGRARAQGQGAAFDKGKGGRDGKPRRDGKPGDDRKPQGGFAKAAPGARRKTDDGGPRKPHAGKSGAKDAGAPRARRDGPGGRTKGKGPGSRR